MPATAPVLHMRWMVLADLGAMLAIEEASFSPAWTEENFRHYLRRRNCIGMVAIRGETIVGYMLYELHTDHLRLLTLAVAPAVRREGVGAAMMVRLVHKLHSHRRRYIVAEVQESDLAAQLFLSACEMRAVKMLRESNAIEFQYVAGAEDPRPKDWKFF